MYPKVSVVIPLHNKERHIRRCLDSVFNQTYKNVDVIVVDDCSSDRGAFIAREYVKRGVRLLSRSSPGPGGYAARNLGIQSAIGEWIAFIDADDEWECFHLENFISALNKFPEMSIYGSNHKKDFGNGRVSLFSKKGLRSGGGLVSLDFNGFLETIIQGQAALWTSATIVRKDAFDRAKSFPAGKTKSGGDTDTWIRLVYHSSWMVWCPHPSVIYHLDADNRVMNNSSNYERNHLVIETCDNIIKETQASKTRRLLMTVQARKFYERSMALKKHSSGGGYKLPEVRLYYFLKYKRCLLALMPNFVYRSIKRVV